MKIYGYSKSSGDELLELAEVTISANPECLRSLATFLVHCAESIIKKGCSWEHEHFEEGESPPVLVVHNPDSE
ncbi:Imm32 family immunity protein [Microbulbifer sp. ZKSA004]|uniref:Imm32 family immunity protein n=1 Tax=Microbulbifer sp. ZKSA004 TaxID=3243389 RepID=UPI00403A3CA9